MAGSKTTDQLGWRRKQTTAASVVNVGNIFAETPIKADEKPEAGEAAVEADLSQHGLPTLIGIIDLIRAGQLLKIEITDHIILGRDCHVSSRALGYFL